jgi:hypothetical protein
VANFIDTSFLPNQDIEATARYALTNSVGLDCSYPIDLFSVIESWGIDAVANYSPEPYLAKILLTQCPKIIINTQKSIDEIKAEILINPTLRFSIAHELGHYFLNKLNNEEIKNRFNNTNSNKQINTFTAITEFQANEFAAALLIPEHSFKNYQNHYGKPLEMAQSISNDYLVSLTTAFLRMAKLSENITLCLHIDTKTRKIKHLAHSKLWDDIRYEHKPYWALKIYPKSDIPRYSVTNKILSNPLSSSAGIKNNMPIERWFEEYHGDNTLNEWVYPFADRIITYIEVDMPDY